MDNNDWECAVFHDPILMSKDELTFKVEVINPPSDEDEMERVKRSISCIVQNLFESPSSVDIVFKSKTRTKAIYYASHPNTPMKKLP